MSYLIDQESFLSFFAQRLGVEPANLGERDIRLALALYHGAYLPMAATIELRANELDLRQRYAEFGFEPNTPSFATAKVRVTVPTAPTTSGYHLAAPFIVTQGDKRLIATEPLTIAVGQTVGEATVKAELQGADGTPDEAAATIAVAAGWLRGATITLTDVTPGRDGSSLAEIQSEFRAYAFNPQALVRDVDHADYVQREFPAVARALAVARTETSFDGSTYTKDAPKAGHLTLALFDASGNGASAEVLGQVKTALLQVTVPYGASALHVVPGERVDVTGTIKALTPPGLATDDTKQLILDAIDTLLDWRSWPHNRHVYSGDIWRVVNSVSAVRYATAVDLTGQLLDGTPDDDVRELEPWQAPRSGFTLADITLAEEP